MFEVFNNKQSNLQSHNMKVSSINWMKESNYSNLFVLTVYTK